MEKERPTQLDANFSVSKDASECVCTDGLLLRLAGQPFNHALWKGLTRTNKDEFQMGLGAPTLGIAPLIHNATRCLGGSIKESGDIYQQNGGRDTELQRDLTCYDSYMQANGRYSHSGFDVITNQIRKMEALLLHQGMAKHMTERAQEAASLVSKVIVAAHDWNVLTVKAMSELRCDRTKDQPNTSCSCETCARADKILTTVTHSAGFLHDFAPTMKKSHVELVTDIKNYARDIGTTYTMAKKMRCNSKQRAPSRQAPSQEDTRYACR